MSMISAQCDKLHTAAQTERMLGHYELEQMLLDAADTILELNVRLTHMELHECPSCKNVADLQEALDENAKLREELEQWHRLTAGIELPEYPVTEFKPKDLERDNAKLRELVRDMWPHVRHRSRMCAECELPCDESDECLLYEPMRDRMSELGIEVD